MPFGFVDDPEGDVADEEVDDDGFGNNILAADADGDNVLLPRGAAPSLGCNR